MQPVKTKNGAVAPKALQYSSVVDDTLGYTASAMFCTLHSLADNRQTYTSEGDKLSNWAEVTKRWLETKMDLLGFDKVP